jgi:hypothetical protein
MRVLLPGPHPELVEGRGPSRQRDQPARLMPPGGRVVLPLVSSGEAGLRVRSRSSANGWDLRPRLAHREFSASLSCPAHFTRGVLWGPDCSARSGPRTRFTVRGAGNRLAWMEATLHPPDAPPRPVRLESPVCGGVRCILVRLERGWISSGS